VFLFLSRGLIKLFKNTIHALHTLLLRPPLLRSEVMVLRPTGPSTPRLLL